MRLKDLINSILISGVKNGNYRIGISDYDENSLKNGTPLKRDFKYYVYVSIKNCIVSNIDTISADMELPAEYDYYIQLPEFDYYKTNNIEKAPTISVIDKCINAACGIEITEILSIEKDINAFYNTYKEKLKKEEIDFKIAKKKQLTFNIENIVQHYRENNHPETNSFKSICDVVLGMNSKDCLDSYYWDDLVFSTLNEISYYKEILNELGLED